MCIEAGKPIRDARGEVTRMLDTFRIAAEESVRIHGEVVPLDTTPRARGYSGMWKRIPVGPCAFITPFNFPINLAAHKIAPALAVGCPFVLKPASDTPVSALMIGEALAETSLPEGAFSILPCSAEQSRPLVEDERLRLLSFTGSPGVGWDLKRRAGRKKAALRLEGWIASAVRRGAKVLCGGSREGAMMQATLLEGVPKDKPLCTQEAFGPVAMLSRFSDFDSALREVNESAFGLQAGLFTRDLYRAQRAWDRLEVGGVILGDVPSWRSDAMPYGGVKGSGLGREGVRFAMQEMSEIRMFVIRTP